MKTKMLKCTGLLIGLLFVFSLFPQAAADVVWMDNFNDGNYDGWTVTDGDWLINGTDNHLTSEWIDWSINRIWYPSSQIVGTWSFDIYQGSNIEGPGGTWICYIANGTDPPDDYYGYGIRIAGTSVYLVKVSGFIATAINLGVATGWDLRHVWTHIDVTRNSTGGFNVYINAPSNTTPSDISVVDTDYSYSERLVIHNTMWGNLVDNFIVDDEIWITNPVDSTTTDTTTPSTTPTNGGTPPPIEPMLLIAGAGAAAVVIIAVVVLMKRR